MLQDSLVSYFGTLLNETTFCNMLNTQVLCHVLATLDQKCLCLTPQRTKNTRQYEAPMHQATHCNRTEYSIARECIIEYSIVHCGIIGGQGINQSRIPWHNGTVHYNIAMYFSKIQYGVLK